MVLNSAVTLYKQFTTLIDNCKLVFILCINMMHLAYSDTSMFFVTMHIVISALKSVLPYFKLLSCVQYNVLGIFVVTGLSYVIEVSTVSWCLRWCAKLRHVVTKRQFLPSILSESSAGRMP